ncbi:alpha-1,4-N-acetylglucosaminyltransferase-like isoform X1 [Bombina bombina]|uniref:alpha-1,4-N-acetylglucosaminyltransferase-like isoform X1 n=1 Tax=Bombina bombina TaxID=8345 RepID=UPI00235A9680|nr:alpha-1,4-N-acetylglucosaminyltransferase-like isoform X1 [Bombina bombina]XP_053565740.1 alpha-1,4-N-acetylglucosaminyltransferase-like isoform X1 [Bombina bombina]XP_053565741.1 alpha-1,4-N-acetylglucosaminyltransferase-like isoform X1 [Bombina bombina]XP_053565742.1 alpha-1,4-N-acetylglucosaminyltransferase-like isoform X1 [Bombina bombina]XP_053565744.1 alpha-1,4-N-acetylglucosaminyltransferase-like isoform X1 [Bombina bombina]
MVTKKNTIRIFGLLLLMIGIGYIYKVTFKESTSFIPFVDISSKESTNLNIFGSSNPLNQGNGIIFLETMDVLTPTHLVTCAVESAARVYPDRPVVLFMKGLVNVTLEDDQKKVRARFPALSSFENVYIFALKMEEIFKDTPLLSWYLKVDPKSERYWSHVSADGCRLALIWKYGGMYMDTDIISFKAVPVTNFLAAESSTYSSNGALGFSPHHDFIWKCMEDFVRNYKGEVWGQQGPLLLTRILAQFCSQHNFKALEDLMCGNITFLNPVRFYKLQPAVWRTFFEVWKVLPDFNDSYGSHFWNYMNHVNVKQFVIPGSNTLTEHLYKEFCPNTYETLKTKI